MAESKVNRDNYIALQGWMITELGLKGNELIIYACIWGFSQAENQTFTGSLQYLADWTNSTKRSVITCLKSLVDKELLVKKENTINGVKFCEYHATKFTRVVKKVHQGSEESSTGGGEKSSPNNIAINNIDYNNRDNIVAAPPQEQKKPFGSLENVKLTDSEFQRLIEEYGEAEALKAIVFLDEYIANNPKYKRKSHYLALRRWVFDAIKEKRIKAMELEQRERRAYEIRQKQQLEDLKKIYGSSFDTDDFFNASLKRTFGEDFEL